MATSIALLLGRYKDVRERRVVGEKTPNNLLHLTQLDAVFPRAKFVQVIRDGRDCAVSAWFHNQRTNPSELQRRHENVRAFLGTYRAHLVGQRGDRSAVRRQPARPVPHRPL